MGNLCTGSRKSDLKRNTRSSSHLPSRGDSKASPQGSQSVCPPRDKTHARLQKQIKQRTSMSKLEQHVEKHVTRLEAHLQASQSKIQRQQQRNCMAGSALALAEVGHTTADIATMGASLAGTGPSRISAYATGVSAIMLNNDELEVLRETLEEDIQELKSLLGDYGNRSPDKHSERATQVLAKARKFKSEESSKQWRTCHA